MKLFGKPVDAPNLAYAIIPRENGPDIVLHCAAVLDRSEFDALCPPPSAPAIIRAGVREHLTDDDGYRARLAAHAQQYEDWVVITSLRATPGLEWEQVDYDKPDTWRLWRSELQASKFSLWEIGLVIDAVYRANGLSEQRIAEARALFRSTRLGGGADEQTASAE